MLRLYLPAAIVGGVSLEVTYSVVAWLCWVPNLMAAEWLVSSPARRDATTQREPC